MAKTTAKKIWDFSSFYKSVDDPKIEDDMRVFEDACSKFEKTYKAHVTKFDDAAFVAEVLQGYEYLIGMIEGNRPIYYLMLNKEADTTNEKIIAAFNRFSQREQQARNKLLFVSLTLGKLPAATQSLLLISPKLTHFRYFLERIFLASRYQLTEREEQILAKKQLPSYELWVSAQKKFLSRQTFTYKGKQLAFSEAFSKLATLPTKPRRALYDALAKARKEASFFSEAELNAVIIDKKINDELRGFEHPYSSTILEYQNDEKSIINLVETVTKNFPISHEFFKLRAKLLKLPKLLAADHTVPLGKITRKYPLSESIDIVTRAFDGVDPEFGALVQKMFAENRVDVYPRTGKRSGAFCAGKTNLPEYILMNYNENGPDSRRTLAHELGHAIHFNLSTNAQSPLYDSAPYSTAEVASTFFEKVLFDEEFKTLSDKEKVIALHDKIENQIHIIFRQVAAFNFELELHNTIRTQGSMSTDAIAKILAKHLQAQMGPAVKLDDLSGYSYIMWPHFRYFFYVYSYAYGQIISNALYKRYTENPAYLKEIKKFLSAGSSKSPEEIFKEIGIDTTKPEFFEDGIKSIAEDIRKLKILTEKKGR